ncbi:MAG: hypothetical protein H0W90_08900 [Actinobacteria bacterium]|nr:hypothetical protein [Actinomycetota bacterium]
MARPRSSRPNVRRLKRAIDAAVVASRTPPEAGAESWPFTFPQEHLQPNESLLVWDVVRYIRRDHRDLYREFLHERTIYDHIVEYVAQTERPTLPSIVTDLRRRASQETIWLVDIPLLNLLPQGETLALAKDAMLVRTDQTRRGDRRFGSYLKDMGAVRRHLGDELTPRDRWLTASQAREVDVDTRMGTALLLVEQGIEEVAVNLAVTRARLAVAMWCLLSPPRSQYDPHQPWPTVGGWTPVPHVEFGIQRKRYEPGKVDGAAPRRGNHITTHAEYHLTRSVDYLRAPFIAVGEARRGSLCARSLLSAARSLYLAQRTPNELERTERILHVWRAKEALSDPGKRGGKSEDRWARLVVNLRLRSELLKRGYSSDEIDEAFKLMESLRDLATHRPDDVLVNLNYPGHLRTYLHRSRVIDAQTAPLAIVAADWPILLAAVRIAATRLAKGAIKNNWNDKWFHRRFA